MLFIKSVLTTLTLAAIVAASPHEGPHRRHSGLHIELDPEQIKNGTLSVKRDSFSNARLSMYYPETGNQVACGGFYTNDDWVRLYDYQLPPRVC